MACLGFTDFVRATRESPLPPVAPPAGSGDVSEGILQGVSDAIAAATPFVTKNWWWLLALAYFAGRRR